MKNRFIQFIKSNWIKISVLTCRSSTHTHHEQHRHWDVKGLAKHMERSLWLSQMSQSMIYLTPAVGCCYTLTHSTNSCSHTSTKPFHHVQSTAYLIFSVKEHRKMCDLKAWIVLKFRQNVQNLWYNTAFMTSVWQEDYIHWKTLAPSDWKWLAGPLRTTKINCYSSKTQSSTISL